MQIKKQNGQWHVLLRGKKERARAEKLAPKSLLVKDENGTTIKIGPLKSSDAATGFCDRLKKS